MTIFGILIIEKPICPEDPHHGLVLLLLNAWHLVHKVVEHVIRVGRPKHVMQKE